MSFPDFVPITGPEVRRGKLRPLSVIFWGGWISGVLGAGRTIITTETWEKWDGEKRTWKPRIGPMPPPPQMERGLVLLPNYFGPADGGEAGGKDSGVGTQTSIINAENCWSQWGKCQSLDMEAAAFLWRHGRDSRPAPASNSERPRNLGECKKAIVIVRKKLCAWP